MKNTLKTFVFMFLNILLFHSNSYANHTALALDPPTVTSPVNLCQNPIVKNLSAIPSAGCTLIWYGTNSVGGTGSSTPPTINPINVGTTTYYVSQTDGVTESARVPIVVNIVANNGEDMKFFPSCKYLKVTTGPDTVPPTTLSSVYFEWIDGNSVASIPYLYSYSYVIYDTQSRPIGPAITGTTTDTHIEIFGILKGQNIIMTVRSATNPCIDTQTNICQLLCRVITNPDFPDITPICQDDSSVPNLDATSPNGLTGLWTPAVIDTRTPGTFTYRFDPDPINFPCANFQKLNITILPKVAPIFNSFPTTVCQGAAAPVLPLASNNPTPITGTWSPNTVDTSILGTTTYTFTPDNPAQCPLTAPVTFSIIVKPIVTDAGFTPIAPICIGSPAPTLNTLSPLGIKGTWFPTRINTNSVGTTAYTFTPDANQCGISQTFDVTIIPKKVPDFVAIPAFCVDDPAPLLATTSPNNISGTWFPAVVDNLSSGTYIFTPNANECATTQIMDITVNQPTSPDFSNYSICSGNPAPSLDATSPNGITGVWNPNTVDNLNTGLYTFTPNAGQCAIPQTIEVTVLPSKTLIDFNTEITAAFSKNQKITITPIAASNDYLYQLNDGLFQKSPVFENVAAGYHSVTVQDIAGCGNAIVKNNILVIDYPRFFTPNSDGYNDTWNISPLKEQSSSRIYIHDRYGKLLKEISPKGSGWDGTYKGQLLPATDYWFTVEYEEQGSIKKFKSHFTLKR
ncbi:T9SS type B sorting domain-containing protein [Flavobacterium eburneipallidum]|uniref:T9SS type B sorting domain-containing protein n=1 Tax=Flavobacterium eburneipallidum TaxID=3003263 RepID=UPI0024824882|nr:T9SS type B sorting domain-containing protein [Flavobacterium eburneipallidum]